MQPDPAIRSAAPTAARMLALSGAAWVLALPATATDVLALPAPATDAMALPAAATDAMPLPGPATAAVAAEPVPSDTARPGRGHWVILPFVFYTPETRLAGGVTAAHYVRLAGSAEPSSALAAITVTARRQWILEWIADAYLPAGARVSGKLRLRHYPDVFYGVGPGTPASAEEDFTARVVDVQARAQWPVSGGVRAGLVARLRHETLVSVAEDGALAGGGIRGADGGTAVGLGVAGTLDTRDNLFSPRSGVYVDGAWTVHAAALGGDYGFGHGVLDARGFVPVGGSAVLAAQAYLEATTGGAPFSMLPRLGGADRLRGYHEGRFRDRTFVAAQAELRFPIWRRLGGAGFAAVGDVAPGLLDLDPASLEAAAGAGLRFRFNDEGVVLRGDFAAGREGSGLYFTIGHAF